MITVEPIITRFPADVLYRLILALGVGLFIGLEREWRGKEAGLRTFGFVSLIGAMGALLGEPYALLCLAMLGIFIFILNWQSVRANQGAELTTSAALLITGLIGVLCGEGHTISPLAVGVVTAGLLAWKERLAVFSHKLTVEELRAEILLAILTFAVYPVLPTHAIDPWGLIIPRTAWMTVILIAGIGFVNYILWKIYGEEGVELTGFLGGMVNSTIAVTELASRSLSAPDQLREVTFRGVLLATSAMAIRNAVLLGILSPKALSESLLPLFSILIPCALFVWKSRRTCSGSGSEGGRAELPLQSPFSLKSALKFGFYFLVIEVLGAMAHDALGHFGFYMVSLVGGLVSSASAVASAGTLVAQGKIPSSVGGIGAVIASVASAGVNFVLVAQISRDKGLKYRLGRILVFALILAAVVAFLQIQFSWFGIKT